MTEGQQVSHKEFGTGIIRGISLTGLLTVAFDDGDTRYIHPKHGNLTAVDGKPLHSAKPSRKPRIADLTPSDLPDAFVEHCRVFGIAINLQSPEHDMDRCRAILENLGITVPPSFRPIQFGIRGGTIETHTFKLRAITPLPADTSIIPSKFTAKDGNALIYSTPVLLGLLVAGFPITSCNESGK
jgi:hypothetical protein